MLDESKSSLILHDRIWHILLHRPNVWFQGEEEDVRQVFWQLLKFESVEDVVATPIKVLMARVYELHLDYVQRIPSGVHPLALNGASRGKQLRIEELTRLYYWLELLSSLTTHLFHPDDNLADSFSYYPERPSERFAEVLRQSLPKFVEAYRALVATNFRQLSSQFLLMEFRDAPILLEVHHSLGHVTELTYIALPNCSSLPTKYVVDINPPESALKQVTPALTPWRTAINGRFKFGRGRVEKVIDGINCTEAEAGVYFTRLSFPRPILEQAYQLVGVECQALFRGDSYDWNMASTSDHKELDLWIQSYFAAKRDIQRQ